MHLEIFLYWCKGRTSQELQDRIKQHIPTWLRQHTRFQQVQSDLACKRKQPTAECYSSIGQHLSENTNVLPITMKINFLLWTRRTVHFTLVCSKPATSEYDDLFYSSRKSLSMLFNCSNRIWVRTSRPIVTACFFSHSIGQCTTASQASECAFHNTKPCFSFSLGRDYPLTSAS